MDISRRSLLRVGGVVLAGIPVPEAAAVPVFRARTAAARVAARTDRRPVAGGVYDASVRKTFFCWAGKNEDTYVQAYDHATDSFTKPAKVMSGGGDSHNYPTMVQAADGRLLVFVGVHNARLVMARSAQPHAVTGTWTVKSLAEGPAASYPMPFRTADGTLFVFFRETTAELSSGTPTDTRTMQYVRSTDNGVTWRSSKQLTGQPYVLGSTNRSDHLNETYVGQLRLQPAGTGRPERVHLVWTLAGGGTSKHAHDAYHRNIHYATFEPATLTFRTAAGTDVGPQLANAELDRALVVATPLALPGGMKSPDYISLVGWLGDDRPFVVYMTNDSAKLVHDFVAVWTGSAWQVKEVATGLRTRDMEQLGPTTWRVYTNREGSPNIGTYLLESGQTWTGESVITTAKEVQRIEVVAGAVDPARILATGIASKRAVSTADGDVYLAGIAG
jgi:hypothetical protein